MNRTLNITTFILCFCVSLVSFAQDSLKNAYLNATDDIQKIKKGLAYLEDLRFEDPDAALAICDSLILFENRNNSIKYRALIYEHAGSACWQKGDLDKSTGYYKKSFLFNYKNKNIPECASAFNNIAYNWFELGNYTEALRYLNLALQIGKKLNDEDLLSITNTYIAQVNVKLKQYQRGINAYKQTLQYFEREGKTRNQAIVYNNIGNVYVEQDLYDSALFWFNKSYDLNKSVGNEKGMALALSNKGFVYLEQKKYKQAEDDLLNAYRKYDSLNSDISLVLLSSNLARLYTETNKTDKAIQHAEKAEKLGADVASYEQLVNVYNSLAGLHERRKEYDKAFHYARLQLQFSDSLANENAQRIQNEFSTRFETQSLNDKIILLDNTNKLKDAEIEKKKARQNLFIATGVAALIIIILLFYVLRSKNKTQKELESKNIIIEKALQERGVLLKEIHHRVKNNLQIISSLLSLQGGYGDSISTEELVKQSESRIKSMALIHEKLYQSDNLKEINLSDYLDSFMEQLSNLLFFKEKGISYELNVEKINLDIDRIVPLGLIMNELITNSVKHAFKETKSGKIEIKGNTNNGNFIISVTDNGKGMPEKFVLEKTNSLGIRLIRGLANQIKAKVEIASVPGKTSFSLSIPLAG
ncbi:MAG TPA: tetratricopeptide repeat protein [Bacteroidia bacterium]